MTELHLHLISDSTGETVSHVAKASMVQFNDVEAVEHLWPLVRSERQIHQILETIAEYRGFVLFTLVNTKFQELLEQGCRELQVPCVSVLRPVIDSLRAHLGKEMKARPGVQHALDAEYFDRIEAMDFVMNHDDGQAADSIENADVILIGVSRTSKTPTSIYLGNRGVKTANVPVVPGCPLPSELFRVKGALIVGLTTDAKRLVQVRRQRLQFLNQNTDTDYVDPDSVAKEVSDAQRLFAQHGWPTINVTRRSIEETAAAIIQLLRHRRPEL